MGRLNRSHFAQPVLLIGSSNRAESCNFSWGEGFHRIRLIGSEGRREFTMKNLSRALLTASAVLQGKYLGGTQAVLRFEVNGEVQTFPPHDIVALTFTRNSGQAPAPASAPPPQNDPAPVAAPPPAANSYAGGDVTVPAGQSILVRMIDGVDSAKNHVGDVFHASLETDLNINGTLVARKGTDR